MRRTCRLHGCLRPAASAFAVYCGPHRTALRRHGAPDQKAVTKARLAPYLKIVQARIARNADNVAWATLDQRWRALADHAETILKGSESGKAGVRYERIAAQEIVKLAQSVAPREVVEVTAAMIVMQEFEPRAFRSDDAFWMQLARRVRGLSDLHFGESWDNKRQRVRRLYREMSPKAAVIMGRWLAETLGVGGQHIARVELAEQDSKTNLHEALNKLV